MKKGKAKIGTAVKNTAIAAGGGVIASVVDKAVNKALSNQASTADYAKFSPAAPLLVSVLLQAFAPKNELAQVAALGMAGSAGNSIGKQLGIGDAFDAGIAGVEENLSQEAERLANEILDDLKAA